MIIPQVGDTIRIDDTCRYLVNVYELSSFDNIVISVGPLEDEEEGDEVSSGKYSITVKGARKNLMLYPGEYTIISRSKEFHPKLPEWF